MSQRLVVRDIGNEKNRILWHNMRKNPTAERSLKCIPVRLLKLIAEGNVDAGFDMVTVDSVNGASLPNATLELGGNDNTTSPG